MIKIHGSALIKNADGKYLLIRLNKEIVGGVLVPPGGKLEANETLRDCVIREVKEELNIDVEIHSLLAITEEKYDDGFWTFVLYDSSIKSGVPTIMEPGKIVEIKWADITEMKNYKSIKWLK